jgi:hypothetical protein
MNTRNLPASALLLVIGAGAILFIGAFARFDPASSHQPPPATLASAPPLTQDDPPAEAPAQSQLPANLSPGLSELIKLAQAHVDESLIIAYIKSSHQVFAPTADEILYLSDLGLSQDVISALVGSAPPGATPQPPPQIAAAPAPIPIPVPAAALAPALALAAPPPAAIQPEADTTASAFYNDLAPYGAWTQQPDYGPVWQPTVETINSDWTPYVDAGQWLNSDSGWYWQSDYTWGWSVFHYGRWINIPHQGWVWQPGNIWAPAWVAWRSSSSYMGWAPLPPGVGLNVLAQLTYNGKPAGPNATLGLPPSAYTFVNISNFTSRNLPRRVVPAPRINALVQSSVLLDSYAIINNRIFNGGANPEAVAAARHRPVPQVNLRAVSSPDAAGLAMDRKTLAVYVPPATPAGASTAGQSAANSTRAEAPAERSPSQEPGPLAENELAEAPAAPAASTGADVAVQLPPLHYPSPANPSGVRQRGHGTAMDSPPNSPLAGQRDWPRSLAAATVQHPATPAPRFESFNLPARQAEPPRPAIELHPAPAEIHAAPAEPARAAPAPVATATAGSSSRSGR